MKYFESSGQWFTPDDPSKVVGGTLKFDGEGIHLILLGSFRQGWSPGVGRYAMIHGVVGGSPYGAFVTLLDCFENQSTINMAGVTSDKIRCHKAAVGNFHLPEGQGRFESLELDFSYLSEWVGRGGFSPEQWLADGKTYVVTYRLPDEVPFSFGDKTLILGFNFNTSGGTHKTTLTEAARLVVEPVGNLTPKSLGNDHVRTLQDLLSFATDRPNAIEMITYEAEKDERGLTPKLDLIYDRVFRLEENKDSLHAIDMIFNYADTQTARINIFQNWLEFSEKHRAFCLVYFGNIYAGPKFLDEKFAKVMSAFTLLCSTLRETSVKTQLFLADAEAALKAHFSSEELDLLVNLIPTGPKVEMPIHLLRLLGENADIMGQVIQDFSAFVKSVSNMLIFIERRVEGVPSPLQDDDLHYAMEKVRMLIKVIILKELGFGQGAVKALVERNRRLNHLKMV